LVLVVLVLVAVPQQVLAVLTQFLDQLQALVEELVVMMLTV
tara:strand:+ start:136 stop:258 length:123 start_codon:yes stop_codon:yes gene_type:complete